jgi:fructuronate reductase
MGLRLHPDLLSRLPIGVRTPRYRPAAHGVGIAHLGLGAFHRAHQACYVDDVLAVAGGDWRIVGISCRSPAVREQLEPQQGLYTVAEQSTAGLSYRVVGSVASALVAPQAPLAAINAMAQPSVHIISLTITEKAYCRSAASDRLDTTHPDVVHDLANPARPRSALGLLCAALEQRRCAGTAAPTLLSCDNLPHNGTTLRNVLQDYALRVEPRLAEWIARSVACPSTMVDRIVPATTAVDLTAAEAALGMRDEALVKTEPFSQWVIEDHFAGPRPALEQAGVQLVNDVRPFETAKLRLLNGSHSTLAYLGSLAGYSFVHEAIADPEIRTLIQRLMRDELAPTLDPAPGLDLPDYQRSLLTRFENSALPYRLRQIAMDGTQKLPQRLLEPLRLRLQRQLPVTAITFAISAWMRYIVGRTEAGAAYVIDDPIAARLSTIVANSSGSAATLVAGLLSLTDVFGDELAAHAGLRDQLVRQLDALLRQGIRPSIRALLNDTEQEPQS